MAFLLANLKRFKKTWFWFLPFLVVVGGGVVVEVVVELVVLDVVVTIGAGFLFLFFLLPRSMIPSFSRFENDDFHNYQVLTRKKAEPGICREP